QHTARPTAFGCDHTMHDLRRLCRGAGKHHADRVEDRPAGDRARRSRGIARPNELRPRRHRGPSVSGFPIAAMNRCLIDTLSSGGFAAAPDSVTLAVMTHGPGSTRAREMADRSSCSLRVQTADPTPRARATPARSAPWAVAVS